MKHHIILSMVGITYLFGYNRGIKTMKKVLIFALICLILGLGVVWHVLAQEDAPGAIQGVKNSLKAGLFDQIKSFLARFFVWLVETGRKIIGWLRDSIFSPAWNWIKTRGDAIKEGISEEREEWHGGVKKIWDDLWQKVKNIFTWEGIEYQGLKV